MTHAIEDLESGNLIGTKRLKLACGLKIFPKEILSLADTLEILDLSDNDLSELPNDIVQLKYLKIIFFARNKFEVFPSALRELPNLNMIGFKSNQIKTVPENAFPPKLNWLILTDNKIEKLPKSIGDATLLQKCALAGNLINELPDEMAKCVNLELLRVSANKLKSIPKWLFELPKLSWVAFGGNLMSPKINLKNDLESFNWKEFKIQELLGEGASGFISKANWNSRKTDLAIKIFKGDVTSDGLPEDEMQIAIAAGDHESLIPVLGKIKNHPENKIGLIMKLISPDFINLGNPPNFETCTRDVFEKSTIFSEIDLLKIAKSMASVCAQLHGKGINHGDFYAHNILVNQTAESLLGDFGAATFYDVTSELANNIQRVEVSAYGCLLEDLISQVEEDKLTNQFETKWLKLISDCRTINVKSRPSFSEILQYLNEF
jgi:hypothetical protein